MARPCLHFLDRDRSGGVIGVEWRDTQRGVKPGVPDVLVWYRGKSITIELKSRRGQCNPSQRLAREALLRAGAHWWVARSARTTMWALVESGVTFSVLSNDDGTLECWQQPKLPAWEVPKRNPQERRPRPPEWEPEAAPEIAELAAERDDAAALTSRIEGPCGRVSL